MRFVMLSLALFVVFLSKGQDNKEFEGVIKYKHRFLFNSADIDSLEIMNTLGTSSEFYYKEGNYKWIINSDSHTKVEYFDSKTQTVYSLYGQNDTLFMSRRNGYDDSLTVFKIVDTDDSVCGLKCKKAETFSFTKDDSDLQTSRILYYSPAVSIGPDRFSFYRTYASNKVFQKIKCWPVKIELRSKFMPFTYIIEAVQIIPRQLSDLEVFLPDNRPIKQLSLF